MNFKHRNHLVTGYLHLRKQAEDLRALVCQGRNPSGSSKQSAPLPDGLQQTVLHAVDRTMTDCEALLQRHAAAELSQHQGTLSVSTTRMWASILLGQLKDSLVDLHPDKFERKFGPLESSEEREDVRRIIDRMISELEDVRGKL